MDNAMYHNNGDLILASGSPRRQEFLRWMGLDFDIMPADIDENRFEYENPESYVTRMAQEKGNFVSLLKPDSWVISGDTIVCLGGEIFGKPEGPEDAVSMLMKLSGKTHTVISSYSVINQREQYSHCELVRTKVTFTSFSQEIAKAYVATGEPLDKAGSYGIQYRGVALVEKIEGSYSNVVGIPLAELMHQLTECGAVSISVS